MRPSFRCAFPTTLLLAALVTSPTALAASQPVRPTAPHPRFEKKLAAAIQLAHSKFPKAQLLEGDGVPADHRGFSSDDMAFWRFVFDVPRRPGCREGTASVTYYSSGASAELSFICERFNDLNNARFIPTPLHRTLTQAIKLLHAAGYRSAFTRVYLTWPTSPRYTESYFSFMMPGAGKFVWVGTNSGRVSMHT